MSPKLDPIFDFDTVTGDTRELNKYTTKRILGVSLAVAFVMMALSPALAQAQTTDLGHLKTGPFLDRIVFDVIEDETQQIISLQSNEIDIIDQQLDPLYLEALEEYEEIEVAQVLRNGYGYIEINCAKYPLNITALRRAISFATDKTRISDDVWDGLSDAQDSVVPKTNPYSIEGQLGYTYYEENIPMANSLLDAAGFLDIDEDGFREAPDGSDFDILLECSQSSPQAIEVGLIVAEAMVAIGIDAVSQPTDFYEYLQRLYYHGDYDMVFLGTTFTTFDVDWLAYSFWSEYIDEPFQNTPNFVNATYDSWRDQLLHSTDYDEVYEAAIEMQRILTYECPQLICYENIQLTAYRTDRFEGQVNDVVGGIPGYWTLFKTHLKESEGGPYGGTLRTSNSLDIDSFNFMTSTSGYSQYINNMMWDSLMTTDGEGNDVMWLAESFSSETHADDAAIPDGYTRFTFNIIQNATWTDGMPLTADDVAYSLNFYRDAPGNLYGPDLGDLTAAYATTTYQLIVEFRTESYWHLHTVAYKPVIPKHVFIEIGVNNWNRWNPIPPVDAMVTSGPYNVSEYIAGEFTEMSYNPNFFFGPDRSGVTPTTPPPTGPDLTMAIVAGAVGAAVVIIIGGYVLLRQR
ncbi:MAG: ABC transporter substrate-binding protein [Candidatus Thorarchaeota archaeon]|jgi:ABC-type transport system substrate-binding protein